MRIVISLTACFLLASAAIGVYFIFDARRADSSDIAAQKEADARKKLAFVSLADRLPKGKAVTPTKPLNAEAKKRWEMLDHNLATHQGQRAELLKALHDKTRKFFVESQGFGSMRPVWPPPDKLLLDELYVESNRRQHGAPADFPVSPGETLTQIKPNEEFHYYHELGLDGFLYPFGFGYVKDRDHVAGFSGHGFRYLGVPSHESKRWRIHHVQLVGILAHAQPVVYLTDQLPSMEQVRQGRTRELDYFEEAALPALCTGEDLYIVSKDDTLRMLGALRATKTCQQCHDANIGDLLGAFSYTLRPAPKEMKQEP